MIEKGVTSMVQREVNIIKFTNEYANIWKQRKAELLDVRVVEANNLSQQFREYALLFEKNNQCTTQKWVNVGKRETEYLNLPEMGKVILLDFRGDDEITFTVPRPYTPLKYTEYKNKMWQDFEIQIEEKKKIQ